MQDPENPFASPLVPAGRIQSSRPRRSWFHRFLGVTCGLLSVMFAVATTMNVTDGAVELGPAAVGAAFSGLLALSAWNFLRPLPATRD